MPTATLGTLLRHVTELLDGAVEQAYAEAGLDWRPRYTPILRALLAHGPLAIRAIATHAGITHSAVSQTVAQLARRRLVALRPGRDARERVVALTAAARAIVPALERQWAATAAAAAGLDRELSAPLAGVLREAIAALERQSFTARIAAAPRRAPRTRSSHR